MRDQMLALQKQKEALNKTALANALNKGYFYKNSFMNPLTSSYHF